MEAGQPVQTEMLNGVMAIVAIPSLINEIKGISLHRDGEIATLKQMILDLCANLHGQDRYMSAEEARQYLGMSKGTFDKYRYNKNYKFKSYPLDGKHWFKKSDLDRFMSLYGVKALGLA